MTSERRRTRAFSFTELLVIVAVILLLCAAFLSGLANSTQRSRRIRCTSNLKQIGLAEKTWALANSDQYPSVVSVSLGGAKESVAAGEVFRYFQVMSNEMATPRVLICPADTRTYSTNFSNLSRRNISYFVGLDANDTTPQMFLIGDHNLTNSTLGPSRILLISSNTPARWDHRLHRFQGNVGLADGSVQQFTSSRLNEAAAGSGGTNRLAMP